jgi:hypothetical protein
MKTRTQEANREARPARFGVYLDLPTRKALLKAAIDDDVSATKLVEDLIKDYLAKRGRNMRRK